MDDKIIKIPEMLFDAKNRFWSFVKFGGPDDCWEWQRCKTDKGHGKFSLANSVFYAHRISYFLAYGEPGIKMVCHECNNPPCVNPKHLYLDTQQGNLKKMLLEGRSPRDGEFNGTALFYTEEVIKIRNRFDNGETQAAIARSLGCDPRRINAIVNHKTYQNVS